MTDARRPSSESVTKSVTKKMSHLSLCFHWEKGAKCNQSLIIYILPPPPIIYLFLYFRHFGFCLRGFKCDKTLVTLLVTVRGSDESGFNAGE